MRCPSTLLTLLAALAFAMATPAARAEPSAVRFAAGAEQVEILAGDRRVAVYSFADGKISRPYFAHVTTLSGRPVTRNHPPREGVDPTDHADMHPGIWVAFGEVTGGPQGSEDFWRNRGRVVHERFTAEPKATGAGGSFTAEQTYRAEKTGEILLREVARWSVVTRDEAWWLVYDGQFRAATEGVAFGDQEEMGLGVRVATEISAAKGGTIENSHGAKGEKQVWGKQADWCDYRGTPGGKPVGVAIVPHPENFGASWFHARDYGLLVANPFGRAAFTRQDKSRVAVSRDKPLRLRFGVMIHEGAAKIGQPPEVTDK